MRPRPTDPVPPDAGRVGGRPARHTARRRSGRGRASRRLVEWSIIIVVALALALVVRTFVAQMFFIPSGSMLPTLQIGDRIVVDKLSYHLHGVHRGDVVVFTRPPLEQSDYADLVKRVIGLPGETISSVHGKVEIDGKPLDEPWLPSGVSTYPSPVPELFSLDHPFTIPAGEYFVLGDNRTDSEDSRYFGPISGKLIVGRMLVTVWPLGRIAWVAGLAVASLALVGLALVGRPLRRSRRGRTSPRSPSLPAGGRPGRGSPPRPR